MMNQPSERFPNKGPNHTIADGVGRKKENPEIMKFGFSDSPGCSIISKGQAIFQNCHKIKQLKHP